jgi:hypothetical protein
MNPKRDDEKDILTDMKGIVKKTSDAFLQHGGGQTDCNNARKSVDTVREGSVVGICVTDNGNAK